MVLMSGGFVINDVVWELHETTLQYTSSVLDNSRGLRYNTLNVVIKGYYALNLKEGKMSWQIRNIF